MFHDDGRRHFMICQKVPESCAGTPVGLRWCTATGSMGFSAYPPLPNRTFCSAATQTPFPTLPADPRPLPSIGRGRLVLRCREALVFERVAARRFTPSPLGGEGWGVGALPLVYIDRRRVSGAPNPLPGGGEGGLFYCSESLFIVLSAGCCG